MSAPGPGPWSSLHSPPLSSWLPEDGVSSERESTSQPRAQALDNYIRRRLRDIHEKCKNCWRRKALSRNNHNNYTLEDTGIAIDMHGKCKEFISGEKHCQHAVSSGVRDSVWVISWGLQFVWIIIRSITVNTSSDGVFTRNKTQCSIISWVMVVIMLWDHFSYFFQRSPFPPALYSERFSVTFSISPIVVIGCLLIININCVVRCECLSPSCPVNYRT